MSRPLCSTIWTKKSYLGCAEAFGKDLAYGGHRWARAEALISWEHELITKVGTEHATKGNGETDIDTE